MSKKIVVQSEATNKVADQAEDLLQAHAVAAGHPFDGTPLSLTAAFSDSLEEPLGYLEGVSMQGRFYLSRLAVYDAARGQGVGTLLMSQAEQIAYERGDAEFILDTWSFQAEEFYAELGYDVIARLPDLPNGAGKVWMSKKLNKASLG